MRRSTTEDARKIVRELQRYKKSKKDLSFDLQELENIFRRLKLLLTDFHFR